MKSIIFIITFLLSFSIFSQEEEYVSAKGIIKNIEMKRSGRTVKEIAKVTFSTEQGETIETYVELERVPFLGSFKSVGDEITINYNKKNPAMRKQKWVIFFSITECIF
ncbi:MAG: hypothetical protein HC854_13890 [Flavobacterium sp.]|nr:hypothetical protein [Flavobacterium sp.]